MSFFWSFETGVKMSVAAWLVGVVVVLVYAKSFHVFLLGVSWVATTDFVDWHHDRGMTLKFLEVPSPAEDHILPSRLSFAS